MHRQPSTVSTSITTTTTTPRPRPGSANAIPYASTSANPIQISTSFGSIVPPPAVPPRRASEVRDLRPHQTTDEPDLISFGVPQTSHQNLDAGVSTTTTPTPTEAKYQRMVSDINRLSAQYKPPPANPFGFHPMGGAAGGVGGSSMQLVPYPKPQSSEPSAPVSLTMDQLNKLYSMSYTSQQPIHALHPPGFMRQQLPQPVTRSVGWVGQLPYSQPMPGFHPTVANTGFVSGANIAQRTASPNPSSNFNFSSHQQEQPRVSSSS